MTLPYQLIHQPRVSSWSGMMTLRGLWFDRRPRTRLIRLFSHAEKRRSHPLCLTDTCLMIPLPWSARGPMGLEPSTQEAKKQVKAGMSWRQVLSGRVQHEYIKKKAWMSPSLANRLPGLGRFHSSHMPWGYTGSSHFKAHLPIFACSTFCDNGETGSNSLSHSSLITSVEENFWAFALYSGVLERRELKVFLFFSQWTLVTACFQRDVEGVSVWPLTQPRCGNRGRGKKKKQLKELLLPQDSLPQGQVIEAEISQLQQNL